MSLVGVIGGTFDPLHTGHLVCADQARSALGLDEVVFVPANCSSFKVDVPMTDARIRFEMCVAALRDEPCFSVSDVDLRRGGVTYTVDTLADLKAARPHDEFVFIGGSDSIATIDRWYRADELAKLCRYVAIARPGHPFDPARLAELAAQGFDITIIEAPGIEVAGTQLREAIAAGRSVRYLVPRAVCDIINREQLYREYGEAK